MKRLGGVHTRRIEKTRPRRNPELLPTPSEIVMPMSMHIGAPAKPVSRLATR